MGNLRLVTSDMNEPPSPATAVWDQASDPAAWVSGLDLTGLNHSQRALIGARMMNVSPEMSLPNYMGERPRWPVSALAAGRLLGVGPTYVVSARKLLRIAAPWEIEQIERGELSVNAVVSAHEDDLAPSLRRLRYAGALPSSARADANARKRREAAEWQRLRGAIEALTSFPRASDTVEMVRRISRSDIVDKKLLSALKWLEEFADAWTRR